MKIRMKEFSKWMIVLFSAAWLMTAAAGAYYVFEYREGFSDWLMFIGVPMTAGLIGYFGKAAFENVKKIQNSINERL